MSPMGETGKNSSLSLLLTTYYILPKTVSDFQTNPFLGSWYEADKSSVKSRISSSHIIFLLFILFICIEMKSGLHPHSIYSFIVYVLRNNLFLDVRFTQILVAFNVVKFVVLITSRYIIVAANNLFITSLAFLSLEDKNHRKKEK